MANVQNQQPRRRIWYSKQARSHVEPDQAATARRPRAARISPSGIGNQGATDANAIVFVIDDDESIRESLRHLVRSAGLRVKVFASAEEFLRSKHPDVAGVLVLDVHLPGLSGFDLRSRMSETAPQIPIIFITGNGDIPMSARAMQSGAVTFLAKPFRDDDLIEAIRQGIERDRLARQRIAKLTDANEALRGWLDAPPATPKVDDILGQVMAATTRQLNASSSALFLRNEASNHLALELVFQRNRILTPAEANYPESLGFSRFSKCGLDLAQLPAVLVNLARDQTLIADAERYHLLGLGVKTVLVIPLLVDRQLLGSLNFQFLEEREFGPEEIQIARALAAQTSLAVQFTRSAKSARQSAVLEERNRLASEIHDSLAQTFVAIAIQLNLAGGAIGPDVGKGARYLDQAKELARFGLAEARRTALCLRPFNLDKIGLIGTLEMLVERSKIPGRLSCSFSANDSRANDLPPKTQEHLLRIAQEAICNAVRHANPKVISVSLRCKRGYLELQIQDDGRGISAAEQLSQHGLGLINMQNRAKEIGARLYIHGEPGRGTAIVVRLPVNG